MGYPPQDRDVLFDLLEAANHYTFAWEHQSTYPGKEHEKVLLAFQRAYDYFSTKKPTL